uniref:Ig-like domain-containing protein n=1 Tax=Electrophorus electricus TaxID=8005 RepID=A0A4W4E5M7_ELEEL
MLKKHAFLQKHPPENLQKVYLFIYLFKDLSVSYNINILNVNLSLMRPVIRISAPITSLSTVISFKEDQTVTLSCNYSYTGTTAYLQWYRQYSNSKPQFLVLVTEYGQNQTADSDPRLSTHVHKSVKRVDLLISSAVVSDSALYYCALQPTSSEN